MSPDALDRDFVKACGATDRRIAAALEVLALLQARAQGRDVAAIAELLGVSLDTCATVLGSTMSATWRATRPSSAGV